MCEELQRGKMRAAVYLGKENIEIRELDIPEVGDNDVLVRNIYSSICGTDTAVFMHGPNTGHRVDVGGEFGHGTVSRVVKTGKNITEFSVGERVYPYPRFAKNDTRRAGTIGGFSEYILIPEAKKYHSLYPVDERISDRAACLIETVYGRLPCRKTWNDTLRKRKIHKRTVGSGFRLRNYRHSCGDCIQALRHG